LWREYQQHVGEGPVSVSGHDPLLISLPDLRAKDAAIVRLARTEMLKTSDWDANRFGKHRGVKTIRETIHRETRFQYCDYIPNSAPGVQAARLACIRKLHPGWDPSTVHPHSALDRRKMISDKYTSMEQEAQINVVNDISTRDRVVLAVHLALIWYHKYGQSGAA